MLGQSEFSPGLFSCVVGTEDMKSQELQGGQLLPCDEVKEANLQGDKNNKDMKRGGGTRRGGT